MIPVQFALAALCLCLPFCLRAQTAPIICDRLTCEDRANPLGMDLPQPGLSWTIESNRRAESQVRYQLLAASSPEALAKDQGDLWDSGQVASDQTTYIPYAGHPLSSAQQVFWKVRAWDQTGQPSPWSETATWTAGLFNPADWKAKWISAAGSADPVRATLGYHSAESLDSDSSKWVQVDLGQARPITAIRLDPVADQKKAGFGFPVRFKVEVSNDSDFLRPTTISDHTQSDFRNPGAKPVLFDSGKGPARALAQGRYVRVTATRLYAGKPADFFALSQIEVISAGENVALHAPVAAKDSDEGEGWAKASLTDGLGIPDQPTGYPTLLLRREFVVRPGLRRAVAFVCGLGYDEMTLNGAKVADSLLTPGWTNYKKTCLYDTYDVSHLLRPGVNVAGLFLGNGMYNDRAGGRYAKFQVSFGPQQAIGQLLLEYADGASEIVPTDEQWRVAAGPGTYNSPFGGEDYDARLVQPGWDEPGFNAAKWVPAILARGPGGELKGVSCSGPPIRGYQVLKPVKTTVFTPGAAVYDFGQNAAQIPRITVRGPAGSSVIIRPAELLRPDGHIAQLAMGSPIFCTYTLSGNGEETWSPRFFYCGYRYLQLEMIPAPGGSDLPTLEGVESTVIHSSSPPAGIGPKGSGGSQLTPRGITATAFYYEDCLLLSNIARLLGLPADVTKYGSEAEKIRAAFNAKFFNPATNQYGTGSQAANAIALVMGLADPQNRAAVLQNIVLDVTRNGLTAGDVGYRYLLRALAEGGRSDVIFAMNNQSDRPGYGYQLKQGATSLTEAWNASRGASQNHFMLGQINEWFFHDLAGIQSDAAPGFKKIIIDPAVGDDLPHVKATYESIHGPITSEWQKDGNHLTLRVIIPANTTATIRIPAADPGAVTENGAPAAQSPGLKFLGMEAGKAVYLAPSGTYLFASAQPVH